MLSDKINEKFTSSSAHNLAFVIIGLAQGLFSKEEDKYDYTSQLPVEVRQKIYAELIATREVFDQEKVYSGL